MAKIDTTKVPQIVPGQVVYTPIQMRQLLGGMSRSAYFGIRKRGLLKYSRIDKGRQVVHTRDQYLDYVKYLNTEGEVPSYEKKKN